MVIYLDVLLAVNLYINYFLVRCTALILRRRLTPLRALTAAAAGALSSLAVFLPPLHPIFSVLLKAVIGVLITLLMFGRQGRADFLLSLLCFLAVSFTFAGGMLALWTFAAPNGMYYANGFAYFDIPAGAAVVITAAVYGGFKLVKLLRDRCKSTLPVKVTIRCKNGEKALSALPDTGNILTDAFSGKPVVLASECSVHELLPEFILNYLSGNTDSLEGIRLIPCRTVLSEGIVPAFAAEITAEGKTADIMLGISKSEISGADCIFNPDIFQ